MRADVERGVIFVASSASRSEIMPRAKIDIARNVVSRITPRYSPNMSLENPTYTVLVARSSYAGLVTARTSDGGNFRSRQPLLDGARYWIQKAQILPPPSSQLGRAAMANGSCARPSAMPLSSP